MAKGAPVLCVIVRTSGSGGVGTAVIGSGGGCVAELSITLTFEDDESFSGPKRYKGAVGASTAGVFGLETLSV